MVKKLTVIDDLTRQDHYYLGVEDDCAFYGDYAARQGYAHSATNQLITNLKKSPTRRALPEYRYKLKAIEEAAAALKAGINPNSFANCTFVPVPPSRMRGHPEYDDRMLQVVQRIVVGTAGNVKELVIQTCSTPAAHTTDARPSPDEVVRVYRIDEGQCNDVRPTIIVVDDILTTGSHFVAMKRVLAARFAQCDVKGLFVARRVPLAGGDFHALFGI